jgi:hypothetical protein
MSGPDAMHDEMPGIFPGRPGGEHGEPLLDMLLERRPIPPGAPPELHDLARMLAAAAGPAEPGDLAGEAAVLAAFTRRVTRPGPSHAAPRSARRWLSGRPPRGRLPLAAALVVAAAGLGSTAAAYAGVLPGPIQHLAHAAMGAPDSAHQTPSPEHVTSPRRHAAHHKTTPSVPRRPRQMTPVPPRGSVGSRVPHHSRPWPHLSPGPIPTCISSVPVTFPPTGAPSPSPSQSPLGSRPSATPTARPSAQASCPPVPSQSAVPRAATPQQGF